MAKNRSPVSELGMATDRTPTEIVVHCSGKINSDTIQKLKATGGRPSDCDYAPAF